MWPGTRGRTRSWVSPPSEYHQWFLEFRPRLMAAVPWSLTMREYLWLYRFYLALGRVLAGGEQVGNRRAEEDC